MKIRPKDAIALSAKHVADQAAGKLTDLVRIDRADIAQPGRRRWFLLNVKRRSERSIEAYLVDQGIPVFAPKIRGKQVGSRQPMFPGYLFAHIDIKVEWKRMRSRSDIHGVVKGVDGMPQVVHPRFIDDIRERERVALGGKPKAGYQVGQSVEIAEGIWFGHRVEIHKLAAKGRISFLRELLGRPVVVTVSDRQVFPIEPLELEA